MTIRQHLRVWWCNRLVASGQRHLRKSDKHNKAARECAEMIGRHIVKLQRSVPK